MNKKTLAKVALVCVLTIAASSNANAGATQITGALTIGANASFAPSSNVEIDADASTTAYMAASQHLNGNRIYITTSSDPKMYYKTKSPGTNTSVSVTAAGTIDTGTYTSL
jgi:hypothetical protein